MITSSVYVLCYNFAGNNIQFEQNDCPSHIPLNLVTNVQKILQVIITHDVEVNCSKEISDNSGLFYLFLNESTDSIAINN